MVRKRTEKGFILPPGFKHKQRYLCLWATAENKVIADAGGNYMCAESFQEFDPVVESKMRAAAENMGYPGGRPIWKPGRKVTDMESDDQMERLVDGKIGDPKEEELIALEEQYLRKRDGKDGT